LTGVFKVFCSKKPANRRVSFFAFRCDDEFLKTRFLLKGDVVTERVPARHELLAAVLGAKGAYRRDLARLALPASAHEALDTQQKLRGVAFWRGLVRDD
jgi:hypothetical protein